MRALADRRTGTDGIGGCRLIAAHWGVVAAHARALGSARASDIPNKGVLMITSADVPAPKPQPNHRPLPVFSTQAGLASFTGRENRSTER